MLNSLHAWRYSTKGRWISGRRPGNRCKWMRSAREKECRCRTRNQSIAQGGLICKNSFEKNRWQRPNTRWTGRTGYYEKHWIETNIQEDRAEWKYYSTTVYWRTEIPEWALLNPTSEFHKFTERTKSSARKQTSCTRQNTRAKDRTTLKHAVWLRLWRAWRARRKE